MAGKAGGGKKGRKLGRNKVKCERYRAQGRRALNKERRAEAYAHRMELARQARNRRMLAA